MENLFPLPAHAAYRNSFDSLKVGWMRMACLAVTVISGCAQPQGPTTQVAVMNSPVNASLAGLRSVAVRPFGNDANDRFAKSLEAVMANVEVVDKNQERKSTLTIVGLDRTAPMARESAEPAALAAAAKRLGVDAILAGEIVKATPELQRYTGSKQRCSNMQTKIDKKGNKFEECISYIDVPIQCIKHTVSVELNYRLVSTSAEVLSRKAETISLRDDACEGVRVRTPTENESFLDRLAANLKGPIGGPIASLDQMLTEAFRLISSDIRDAVVPSQKKLIVEWLTASDRLVTPTAREQFNGAIKFAAAQRTDRACEMFRELYASEQQSPDLHYNVGLCDEVAGQSDQALQKYRLADRLLKEPNKTISSALARIAAHAQAIDVVSAKRPELLDPSFRAGMQVNSALNAASVTLGEIPQQVKDRMKTQRRLALVIGNGQYRNINALANPVRDGKAVELALKSTGFSVLSGFDLDHQRTLQLVSRFTAQLKPGDVAIVYFAGHGITSENQSLLLPVDFSSAYTSDSATARSKALAVDTGLVAALKLKGVQFSMLVVDACRDIPRLTSTTRGLARGLVAPSTIASGVLVAYATGAGQTAIDGGAGNNSPFTTQFLAAIKMPNVPVQQAMKQLKDSVVAQTNGLQTPAIYDESSGDFYFSIK